jgi:hypothetical protein
VQLTNIRHVIPAVKMGTIKADSTAFRRLAPKLDYAKARQRWWIEVEFTSNVDLIILEKAVMGSEIRLIELKECFYVEDPRIPDSVNFGEAFRLAERLIPQLNGAVQVLCPPFQKARLVALIELLEDGTGRGITEADVTVHGTLDFPVIGTFIDGPRAPINSVLPLWKGDSNIEEALHYLGADGNVWSNLYKASEIVEDSIGGDSRLLFENGWCSRSEWRRFRRTANHQEAIGHFSRHARERSEPPPDPMTVNEAKAFVIELVRAWVGAQQTRFPETGLTRE